MVCLVVMVYIFMWKQSNTAVSVPSANPGAPMSCVVLCDELMPTAMRLHLHFVTNRGDIGRIG